jgi:hypothetical protein
MKAWLMTWALVVFSTIASAADWEVSPDGAYVIDVKARLAWPRCVEGMVWNGSVCTGEPQLLDHAQAQTLATSRWKAENVRWRLPTSHELQRLVQRQVVPPGPDARLFPGAPGGWHWSGSATVNTAQANPYNYGNVMKGRAGDEANRLNFLHGWAVNLSSGEAAGDVSRRSRLPVRLVRPAF